MKLKYIGFKLVRVIIGAELGHGKMEQIRGVMQRISGARPCDYRSLSVRLSELGCGRMEQINGCYGCVVRFTVKGGEL